MCNIRSPWHQFDQSCDRRCGRSAAHRNRQGAHSARRRAVRPVRTHQGDSGSSCRTTRATREEEPATRLEGRSVGQALQPREGLVRRARNRLEGVVMRVRFIIYETEQHAALERVYDAVECIPRVGDLVGLNTFGYDDCHGLVQRIMHWPISREEMERFDSVADVFVRVTIEDINHFRENDPLWKAYDSVYDINEIASLEPN